jgi:hypothetical protein
MASSWRTRLIVRLADSIAGQMVRLWRRIGRINPS